MKITKILVSALLAVTLLILSVFPSFSAKQPEPISFAILGDSIASGYGLEDFLDSYGALIAKDKQYYLTNNAVPGHKTSDLLWVVCHDETAIKNIKEADLINISIGGNDILNLLAEAQKDLKVLFDIAQNGANSAYIKNVLSTAQANLLSICAEIRALNPDAPIILQTMYNPLYAHPTYKSYAPMLDNLAPSFLLMLQSVSSEYEDIYIADVYPAFGQYYTETSDYSIIQSDGIHPSEKGHQLIAQVITEEINKLEEAGLVMKTPDAYYLLGDPDASGTVTISDATIIQKYLAELVMFVNDVIYLCADVDMDEQVTIKDATAIQKHIAQLTPDSGIDTYMPYYK